MRTNHQHLMVGPVLLANEKANHVWEAIKKMNPTAIMEHHGSYIRILALSQCRVTREAVEQETKSTFRIPEDLEIIMPAFKGKLNMTEKEAVWSIRDNKNEKV